MIGLSVAGEGPILFPLRYELSIYKLEVCHPRCVCENWKGNVVKHNYVN